MKEWTTQKLETVMASHAERKVGALAAELRALHADLATKSTDTRTANLLDTGRDLTALLDHEILEASRGGEDFINDQEYLR